MARRPSDDRRAIKEAEEALGDREPRVSVAAFDRAMVAADRDEAEAALFAIASVPYLDDEDDDGGEERVLTEADMARMEAEIESRPGGWAKVYDEAAAAALAPPPFELSDAACMDIAALLAPYVGEGL